MTTATIELTALTALADQINAAHRDAESAIRESLLRAKQAGEMLLQVKAELPHGEFTFFVESQCEFHPRTARRYIKLAKSWEELQVKTDTILSDLGVTEALKILTSDENVHFASDSSEWYTPIEIIEATIAVMGSIDLDPCSNNTSEPIVPASTHYTIEDDGLSQSWFGRVYLNPPYGRKIGTWVERLKNEFEAGTVTEAIALVPARTDTEWFQKLREYARCFLHGRLRFSGCETPAPFPSVVFYLGNDCSRFAKTFGALGDIYIRFVPEREADFARPEEAGATSEIPNLDEDIEHLFNLAEAIKADGKGYPDSCPICGQSDQVVILPLIKQSGTQYVAQCDRCEKIVRFIPKKEAKKILKEQEADQILATH